MKSTPDPIEGELLLADELGPVFGSMERASGNSFVVQSNGLSRGGYERRLDAHALRLVAVAISKIDKGADMLGTVTVTTAELRTIFTSYQKSNSFAQSIRAGAEELIGLKARIVKNDREYDLISMVSSVKVRHGGVMVQFHAEANSLFLRLSSQFTRFQLRSISKLPNSYSILLYQYLRSLAFSGKGRVPLQSLRATLCVEPDEHVEPHKLISRVIKPAIDAINATSDMIVSFRPVKLGRNIVGIDFSISLNLDTPLNAYEGAVVSMLTAQGMTRPSAIRSIKEHGLVAAQRALAQLKIRSANSAAPPLDSAAAYLATLISKDGEIDEQDKKLMQALASVQEEFRERAFEHLTAAERDAHIVAFLSEKITPELLRWLPIEVRLPPASETSTQSAALASHRTPEARMRAISSHPLLMKAWRLYLRQYLNPEHMAMELYAHGSEARRAAIREAVVARPVSQKAIKGAKKHH